MKFESWKQKLKRSNMISNVTSCQICHKKSVSGFNKPHSLHQTKRVVKPNLQKSEGKIICTRCIRTNYKKRASKEA